MKCRHWLCRLVGHKSPVVAHVPAHDLPFVPLGSGYRPAWVCSRSWRELGPSL